MTLLLALLLPSASYAQDADGDGWPVGYDCDDSDPAVHPGAVETCSNGVDENCDGVADEPSACGYADLDADGVPDFVDSDIDGDGHPNLYDCQPYDPAVNPGAVEVCDGVDNNCDGVSDEPPACATDNDGDGFTDDVDCDDDNPAVYPGAPEVCDYDDNDCDGVIDEDDVCDTGTPPVDADGDGFDVSSDCDDADPSVYPGATEVCNGVDDDCDGVIDEDEVCDTGTPTTGDTGDTGTEDKDEGGGGCSSAGAGASYAAMLWPLGLLGLRRRAR